MVRALVERELTLNLEATGCNKALIRAFLCSWKAGKKAGTVCCLKSGKGFWPRSIGRKNRSTVWIIWFTGLSGKNV